MNDLFLYTTEDGELSKGATTEKSSVVQHPAEAKKQCRPCFG
jgi:hypothetical protein